MATSHKNSEPLVVDHNHVISTHTCKPLLANQFENYGYRLHMIEHNIILRKINTYVINKLSECVQQNFI